jgi:hypothetical protein
VATLEQVIDSVRRKVSDYEMPRKFDSSYYESAVKFALSKLSHDYGESYLAASDVPYEREFLLIKLATIEMCYTRAQSAETSSSTDDDDGIDAIASVAVPDLAVTQSTDSPEDTADRWLKIAADLQAEYDGELSNDGGSSLVAGIEVQTINRKSMKNGGLASRKLDTGLPAVAVSATVAGQSVNLTWTKLFSDLFLQYEVYRATTVTFEDEERVTVIADNHTVEYTDTAPGLGVYYYRVYTVNPNGIKTQSNSLMVEVV